MEATTKQTVHELESLTFEQWWLMQKLINHPETASLWIADGEWIFTIHNVRQNVVPQEDITELAHADLIGTAQGTRGNFVTWWPTISGRAALLREAPKPEPFTYALPGLAAELITPDTSHLERIATALEDIAAGVLAIDKKLQRFINDVDGRDPWASDEMAGHHE